MKYVKILRDGKGVWGVLHGEVVRTLLEPPFEGLRYDGESLPLEACRLLAPCEATKLVCVGKNYYDHIEEMKSMLDASHNPDKPTLFLKAPNALNAHLGTVHAPDFVGRLDYEGELGVVMKRRAKDVPAERAMDYVLGFTCLNDVTARDVQKSDGQWARGKNMDGFAPVGPVVTDEVAERGGGAAEQYPPAHHQRPGDHRLHHRVHDPGARRRDRHRHPRRRGPHASRRHGGGGDPGHRHPAQPDCVTGGVDSTGYFG